jgi:hypothetical protein
MDMHGQDHYKRLAFMIGLSFISMYVLMYAMVNVFANVFPSLNQFYMAGLMTAPMVFIELVLMRSMYTNKKMNAGIVVGGALVLILCWMGIRQQTGIGDKQFLRSMIPHHAGAILMCEKAALKDPEIRDLCRGIIAGQQAEIDLMKEKLEELN